MARILVIEDDIASLELIVYLLKAFGHTPLSANNGITGVELAYREMPDLILCDVQIPGLHGYEVADRLKNDARFRSIPLVAVTAFAMVGDQDKVMAAGFDGYITKPITPESFIGRVESFLHLDLHSALPEPIHEPIVETRQPPPIRATILIVDSIPDNLHFLNTLFTYSGYRVLQTSAVQEALALAKQDTPDLILSDVHLHNESGFDLFRHCKLDPRLRYIPFLFITSSSMHNMDARAISTLGAAGYIVRPIEPQELLAEVEVCLQRHNLCGDG